MGGSKFKVLTSKPGRSSKYIKYYNNSKNNGISWCINGKPTNSGCNVLSNCVGWACGRFNHIYSEITGYDGMKYPKFCCNAENFIEVAKNYGLPVGLEPKAGAIMCWQKGQYGNSSDGAGHVAIVERVDSEDKVFTSESAWNSTEFFNKERERGSDGNWGQTGTYKFRGFIYNPAVTDSNNNGSIVLHPKTPSNKQNNNGRDESKNQIFVKINNLRIRKSPSIKGSILKFAKQNYYYTYTEKVSDSCYTWYKIDNDSWIAYSDAWETLYPIKENCQGSIPVFKAGDSVKLTNGAPIYGQDKTFATWVYNSPLFVRQIDGDRITISIYKSGAITGSVNKKYLTKI